ncbi:MAG: hypothetical protein DRO88_01915 [Promethearchaeia archaeon]|nr:MAG: hypothetical protein DRO88_01915 [Candidatus Lokiarchaeia archaeon]
MQNLAQNYSFISIFSALSWQDFECYLVDLLESVDFDTFRTFRYSVNGRRFEIDCLARKFNQILCIDAKRWKSKTISLSKLCKALFKQHERALAISSSTEVSEKLLKKLHIQFKKTKNQDNIGKKPTNIADLDYKGYEQFDLYPIILVSHKISEIVITNEGFILDFSQFNDFIQNFQQFTSDVNPIRISKNF